MTRLHEFTDKTLALPGDLRRKANKRHENENQKNSGIGHCDSTCRHVHYMAHLDAHHNVMDGAGLRKAFS